MAPPDDLIEVIECFTTVEAEPARAQLASEDIEARVVANDIGGMYPGVSLGGIQLLARAEDLENGPAHPRSSLTRLRHSRTFERGEPAEGFSAW